MKMRVLIHGINFSPELTGIGKYTGEKAEWLSAQGHEVRVVTSPPYYPQWRVGEGYSGARYKREFVTVSEAQKSSDLAPAAADGSGWIATSAMPPDETTSQSTKPPKYGGKVAGYRNDWMVVYRCPLWVPAEPSGLKRVLHLASFALSSFPVMLRQIFWRPDVVLVIEPPLMSAPAALLVARLSGARAWLHVQDFEVDAAFDLGIIESRRLRNWVLNVEQWLMRRFDRVSTISSKMLEKLDGKGVASGKAMLFPNWVDTGVIFPLDAASPMRTELGIAQHKTIALYSGNMGEKQGLEIVLDAASDLANRDDIQFVLCGEGAAKMRLQDKYGSLPNVMWLSLQPVERLNNLLNMADIHLLPQRADAADLVMPSRLTGMLASGRPVVATAYSGTQVAEVVQHCGFVVTPGDADKLAQAIVQLAGDEATRSVLGKKARDYAVANLERNVVLAKFEEDLLACVR